MTGTEALSPVWLAELVTPYTLAVNVPYALAFAGVAAEVAWLARRPRPVARVCSPQRPPPPRWPPALS